LARPCRQDTIKLDRLLRAEPSGMMVMTMEIAYTDSVKIALRTLSTEERSRLQGLFVALGNWDNDPHIQKMSRRLPYKDVYVLRATDGTRVFFNKGTDRITILDIAKKETVDQFADEE
jgi:mRNA-degrading endonuclease RelE of RelBE toxin-antitoxin system